MNGLDVDITKLGIEIKSRYYFPFRTNTLVKRMITLINQQYVENHHYCHSIRTPLALVNEAENEYQTLQPQEVDNYNTRNLH